MGARPGSRGPEKGFSPCPGGARKGGVRDGRIPPGTLWGFSCGSPPLSRGQTRREGGPPTIAVARRRSGPAHMFVGAQPKAPECRSGHTGGRQTLRPAEGLPQLGVLTESFVYAYNKHMMNGEMRRKQKQETPKSASILPDGFSGAGGPEAHRVRFWGGVWAPFWGGPRAPYRPLLNSDNGNQPAMSSGRHGGAPWGPPFSGGPRGGPRAPV